jgi:exo-beta-1,3-glucanase (GH17 family)
MWLASVMQMRKRRCARAGSNSGAVSASRRTQASASRTVPMSASARGVGCMPEGVRTNSGSCSSSRSLPNQMLTVGWLCPSCSAARVTLRVL